MLEKIKYLFAVLLLTGFVTQPTLADGLNQDDMAFAFGHTAVDSDLGEIALLSDQEMRETEGEFWPVVIIGARIGYSAYRGYRAYRIANQTHHAYRGASRAWRATSNYTIRRYKNARGSGVTWYNSRGKRAFSIDNHRWSGMNNWYKKFHYHRRPGIEKHRPWQRGL